MKRLISFICHRPARIASVGVLALTIATFAAPAGGQDSKGILVLQTYGADAPARFTFDDALASALRGSTDIKADIYFETLDPNRFSGEAQTQRLRTYLRERYADKRIAVVAAVYDRALTFLLDTRDPLFPDVPIAALVTGKPVSAPDRVSIIREGDAFGDSAALALTLQPKARQIVIIDGVVESAGSDAPLIEAIAQIEARVPQLPVEVLRNLPLEDLLARLQALPRETIIIMLRQAIGRGGEAISNAAAVKEIAHAAPAPVFAVAEPQIGLGALGGAVINLENEARQLARLAVSLAANPSAHAPPARTALVPTFNWRELKRWGISEAALPAGSVVRFRQLSVWDQYQSYIIGAALIFVFQTALIAGLIVQRARRRRTEQSLVNNQAELRRSYEENRDLAGRLIDAQEAERTRIARDLHDDLSQQLAGVGIMLSALKRNLGKPNPAPDFDQAFATLQARTAVAAETVRKISHELHPSVLEHAGLVATLKRHCADIAQRHDVEVSFRAEDDLDSLRPDVALCLFRVVQEALTNAVRHADPRRIDVQLTTTDEGVELSVMDDGHGFIVHERTGSGLGLRSIDERVRLIRGNVQLQSRPAEGTRLLVRIPHAAAATLEVGQAPLRSAESGHGMP